MSPDLHIFLSTDYQTLLIACIEARLVLESSACVVSISPAYVPFLKRWFVTTRKSTVSRCQWSTADAAIFTYQRTKSVGEVNWPSIVPIEKALLKSAEEEGAIEHEPYRGGIVIRSKGRPSE